MAALKIDTAKSAISRMNTAQAELVWNSTAPGLPVKNVCFSEATQIKTVLIGMGFTHFAIANKVVELFKHSVIPAGHAQAKLDAEADEVSLDAVRMDELLAAITAHFAKLGFKRMPPKSKNGDVFLFKGHKRTFTLCFDDEGISVSLGMGGQSDLWERDYPFEESKAIPDLVADFFTELQTDLVSWLANDVMDLARTIDNLERRASVVRKEVRDLETKRLRKIGEVAKREVQANNVLKFLAPLNVTGAGLNSTANKAMINGIKRNFAKYQAIQHTMQQASN